jgi:electron transfer flavoprotein alpha subunit
VYAGKAVLDVRVTTPVKVFTLRPNVFTAAAGDGVARVESMTIAFETGDFATTVKETKVAAGRPDVTEADIVVSGGRGMKGPENFHFIEELADVLGGGVGASRAVVDAGWRPHDEQVGQTGKTVSHTLHRLRDLRCRPASRGDVLVTIHCCHQQGQGRAHLPGRGLWRCR